MTSNDCHLQVYKLLNSPFPQWVRAGPKWLTAYGGNDFRRLVIKGITLLSWTIVSLAWGGSQPACRKCTRCLGAPRHQAAPTWQPGEGAALQVSSLASAKLIDIFSPSLHQTSTLQVTLNQNCPANLLLNSWPIEIVRDNKVLLYFKLLLFELIC